MKIDDIARLAGVSKAAVSLAFNNKPGVSEQTREHILNIAEAHGYKPRTIKPGREIQKSANAIIRFVACKNADIVTEHYDTLPFFNELIHHITDQVKQHGNTLVISSIDIQNLQNELEVLEKEQPSAGILLLGTNLTPPMIEHIQSIHTNVVILDTCFEHVDANFVSINNTLGGYQAGKHVVNLGHRNIGYVKSNARIPNFIKREEGFRAALAEHGLSVKDALTFELSPMRVMPQEDFQQAIQQLQEMPTAIFCENDYMAISAIKSLQNIGIRVPEDISVMGFDNIFEAKVISPELTTVHVKKDILAKTAVKLIIDQLDHRQNSGVHIYVNTEVVERRSCIAAHAKKA
ncbi:LacI family DNA-binding transcriptional regulator [Paenibacillus sp. ACRRY]|uniref:LacI family DNA-binding transcriptional regulator n=1 Tax=Paenibacillus sp. ACRRY TaxID=2918208 RepID=UPI001EF600BA|nr:LacI family DNA-binding transcriptional regulator [Paenibacillus sp. ACRRY]MCG7383034.1 LacI family DNA-binding transcriptional regulator [Paenibacillus sp. ACRRY]